MHVIRARNVNYALPMGLAYLELDGERSESRAGEVVVAPEPVTTVYELPAQRVLFYPDRDCNPFFHLMESLWMLQGRRDVKFVKRFAGNMAKYSDDGANLEGAYGHRWRHHFKHDQLRWAIERLKKDPNDRRVVIGMYDADYDHAKADSGGLDIPCNLQIALRARKTETNICDLDMTVFNRSNDIIWGAYGANAVHMSFLQEYLAFSIGANVGVYRQVSNNFHAYVDVYSKFGEPSAGMIDDRYAQENGARVHPLMDFGSESRFDMDLALFFEDPYSNGFTNSFFHKVAKPMFAAHKAFKTERGYDKFDTPLTILEQMPESLDWRIAAEEWIKRRADNWKAKGSNDITH